MYETLKEEMKRQRISGYGLSKITGISCSDIYGALNGKKYMFDGWKQRIAAALDKPINDLFPEQNTEERDE